MYRGKTFCALIIVHNGMPFLPLCLRNHYPFFDQVVVIEGAVENMLFVANADGSSTDGTLQALDKFPDPDRKFTFIRGFWPEKHQMMEQGIKICSCDYWWKIDSDEFYRQEDLPAIADFVLDHDIPGTGIPQYRFWGDLNHVAVGECWDEIHMRLFRRDEGDEFLTYRPPRVKKADGRVVDEKVCRGRDLLLKGLRMYHYSYVVKEKIRRNLDYFHRLGKEWCVGPPNWIEDVFQNWRDHPDQRLEIMGSHGAHPSGQGIVVAFKGEHPLVIREALQKGDLRLAM